MAQTSGIVNQVNAVLVKAKWPHGHPLEAALGDIEAVLKLMLSKLDSAEIDVCVRPQDSTDPGPHG